MNQLCNAIRRYGPLAARILLAQLFIVSGCGKIAAFAKTAAFMAGMGLPWSNVLLTLTIALEVGGGVLLVVGWQALLDRDGIYRFYVPDRGDISPVLEYRRGGFRRPA